jgi:hypothetical protein
MCILHLDFRKPESTNLKLSKMLSQGEFFTTGSMNWYEFMKICDILADLNARTTVYTFMYTTDGGNTWRLQYVIFMCFEEQDQKGSFLSMLNHALAKAGLLFQFQEQRRVPFRYLFGIPVDILPIECPPAPMKIVSSRSINRKDRPPRLSLGENIEPVNDPSTHAPSIAKTEEMDRRAKAGNMFPPTPIECPPAPMKEVVSIDRRLGSPPLFPSTHAPSIAKTEEMDRRAKAGNLFPREWGASLSEEGLSWTV